jgi:NAD(P)-dependent dehydrogenase (short-subunit alcohol dehydrogenase family)
MADPRSRSILVTGAAGGLGAETARLFAGRGWRVFAADVAEVRPVANVIPVKLDVTSTDSVASAIAQIETQSPDGLGAVVNFAGVLGVGPLVEIDEAKMQRIFDINVLGTYRVNKATFPLVQKGRGRIVNISSETGWQRALMFNGPYAMTKHAIEAYSDALRRELMFLDKPVPVIVIQPGPFRTSMTGSIAKSFDDSIEANSQFARVARKVGQLGAKTEGRAHDPRELAEVIWRAVTQPQPRHRYSVKADRLRSLLHYLPTSISDRLLKRALR